MSGRMEHRISWPGGKATLDPVNGQHRVFLPALSAPVTIHFLSTCLTSGTAVLSVDGEAGVDNVVNLAIERIRVPGFAPDFFDLDVFGVNEGAALMITVR